MSAFQKRKKDGNMYFKKGQKLEGNIITEFPCCIANDGTLLWYADEEDDYVIRSDQPVSALIDTNHKFWGYSDDEDDIKIYIDNEIQDAYELFSRRPFEEDIASVFNDRYELLLREEVCDDVHCHVTRDTYGYAMGSHGSVCVIFADERNCVVTDSLDSLHSMVGRDEIITDVVERLLDEEEKLPTAENIYDVIIEDWVIGLADKVADCFSISTLWDWDSTAKTGAAYSDYSIDIPDYEREAFIEEYGEHGPLIGQGTITLKHKS